MTIIMVHLKSGLEEQLAKGQDIILELDWQGAQQIRAMYGEKALFVYILPPSLDILKERLKKRAQDKPEVIEKRFSKAKEDISYYHEFDYIVVNDDLDKTLNELVSIITSFGLTIDAQKS